MILVIAEKPSVAQSIAKVLGATSRKDGLQPVEKTIIDRSVRMVYQEFLADPQPEKMPILEDLYNILRNKKEPEAQRLSLIHI